MSDETKCPTCDSIDNAPMRPMRYCENCQNMFPDNNTPTHKAEIARAQRAAAIATAEYCASYDDEFVIKWIDENYPDTK